MSKQVWYFTAKWCKPCQKIKPLWHKLEEECKDEIDFITVDVDERRDIALKMDISGMPTFVFAHEGMEIHRFSGADQGKLEQQVEKLMNM